MIPLHSPGDEAELALLRSLLDGEGIPYFVHNDRFGSLLLGPRVGLVNAKTILVPEEHATRARELIEDYLSTTAAPRPAPRLRDVIRMIFEVIVFSWFVPGKTRRRPPDERPDE